MWIPGGTGRRTDGSHLDCSPAPTHDLSLPIRPRTLMAWPKQPLPNTSPWMRSEGRKIRCGRQTTRRDSERPRSLRWEAGEPSEPAPGDLSMLQLLLGRGRHMPTATSSRWAPGQDPRPGGGQALTCPFPSAYHAPTYARLQSLFREDGTGQPSWVVI